MGKLDTLVHQYGVDQAKRESLRKTALYNYAIGLSMASNNGKVTDGEAFAQIVDFAAKQASRLFTDRIMTSPDMQTPVMLDDLRRVLIGDGWTTRGRNTGPFALPFQAFFDTGFKPEFRESFANQVQHAMAGIYMGYSTLFPLRGFVLFMEDLPADKALYRATFQLGKSLSDKSILTLASRIRSTLLV